MRASSVSHAWTYKTYPCLCEESHTHSCALKTTVFERYFLQLVFIHLTLSFNTFNCFWKAVVPNPNPDPSSVPRGNHLQIFGQSHRVFFFLFLNNTLCQETFGKIHHRLVKAKAAWPLAMWQAFLKPGTRTVLVSCYSERHSEGMCLELEPHNVAHHIPRINWCKFQGERIITGNISQYFYITIL